MAVGKVSDADFEAEVLKADGPVVVDFKTNRAAPRLAAEAPPAYVRQLALYRMILRKLYPQRAIRAALLWTEIPELMEISASALDAQLTFPGSELDPATPRS